MRKPKLERERKFLKVTQPSDETRVCRIPEHTRSTLDSASPRTFLLRQVSTCRLSSSHRQNDGEGWPHRLASQIIKSGVVTNKHTDALGSLTEILLQLHLTFLLKAHRSGC